MSTKRKVKMKHETLQERLDVALASLTVAIDQAAGLCIKYDLDYETLFAIPLEKHAEAALIEWKERQGEGSKRKAKKPSAQPPKTIGQIIKESAAFTNAAALARWKRE